VPRDRASLKGKTDTKPSTPSGIGKETRKKSPGSRFKGYENFTVRNLKIEASVVCYRREPWNRKLRRR
jgi:hypothetical protein